MCSRDIACNFSFVSMKIMRNIQEHEIVTKDVPLTTLQIFNGVFFFNDNGMFFKEVKILAIRLLDLFNCGVLR